ncbi:hypothetical protein B2I21_08725 [Chryseobacterium mucoviscidosis]|nr:hypothetical protein B2I21_08725 [Chryseobacterium mucoviscidosis]
MAGRDYDIAFRLQAQMNSQFRQEFRNANRQLEEMQRSLRELQNARGPDRAGDDAVKASKGFARAREAAMSFRGALDTVAKFTGARMIVQGIIDGFKEAIGLVGEFDKSFRQLQASTNITNKQMSEIKKQASSLYRDNIGENWDDLTRSMATVKQVTGLTGDALKVATRDAVVYRDVFGEDVTQSIRAADQMTKQFGVSQHEAFNLMAQGYKGGLNMSDELLDSVSEYSVYFNKLGFNANEMFDMFGAGAESGVFQLDKVGDAIKELNIRVKDQSKSSAEGYAALNLNAEQFEQALARGGDNARLATQKIFQALAKVEDPVKRNAAGVALMGTQFEDLEYDAIKAMGEARSQFDKTRETMKNVQNIKYGSVTDAFRAMGRSIEMDVWNPMMTKLLPIVSKFAGWFTSGKLTKAVSSTFKNVGGLISGMFSGAGAGGGFDSLIISVEKYKDMLMDTFREISPHVKSVFGSIKKIVMANIPIFKLVATTVANMAARVIRALTPIISYLASKLWPVISKVFGWLANDVVPQIVSSIQTMAPAFTSVFNKVISAGSAMFESLKPIIDGIVAAFNFAFPYIKEIVSEVIRILTGLFTGLMTSLGGIIDFVAGVFTGDWSTAWNGVVQTFAGIWGGLKALVAGPINAVIRLVNQAIGKINGISVDLPFDMGHIGFAIPTIPEIPAYAKGGFADSPSLAGEKGMEAIIPIDGSKRSKRLYEQTGSMIGANTGGGGDTIHVNVTVAGVATPEAANSIGVDIGAAVRRELAKFEQRKQRVGLA